MILIYTALLCEAQSFIEYYKATKINSLPKIYTNNNIIICIGGVGKDNTIKSLQYIFNHFNIQKAFNIGIAGILDKNIKIGELFCTTHKLNLIPFKHLVTVSKPQLKDNAKENILYDMEGEYFLDYCLNHLLKEDIYIFKIISDHLENNKLNKEFVKQLIFKKLNYLHKILSGL